MLHDKLYLIGGFNGTARTNLVEDNNNNNNDNNNDTTNLVEDEKTITITIRITI